MYLPESFAERETEPLRQLIERYPFATLVTSGGAGAPPEANHLPFYLQRGAGAEFGRLVGHLARANPAWHQHRPGVDALVIFQGPNSYITPSWYASKRDSGKVVPTWNYSAVHLYGEMTVIEDRRRLKTLVETLTDRHEAGRAEPWRVDDAPPDFIERMLGAIVGIEITVRRWHGKRKLSQNRSPQDRRGVAAGLRGERRGAPQRVDELVR